VGGSSGPGDGCPLMGRRERPSDGACHAPGLYNALLDKAIADVELGDPRVRHPEYTPGLSDAERRHLNATSPVTLAAQRRLDQLSRGEPVDVAAWKSEREWGDELPFVADHSAKTVRVYSDDRVEVVEYR